MGSPVRFLRIPHMSFGRTIQPLTGGMDHTGPSMVSNVGPHALPPSLLQQPTAPNAKLFSSSPIVLRSPADISSLSQGAIDDGKAIFNLIAKPIGVSYPDISRGRRSTAFGAWQTFKSILDGFHDERTLSEANRITSFLSLGPISMAVQRAVERASIRGDESAAILEIGAGQRLVPFALKSIYGDKIITHELSPKYSRTRGAIDVEMPAAPIDTALLPEKGFELVYSFYGSIYGSDQKGVLDKVTRSLRPGGEALLMWSNSYAELASLFREKREFFLKNGIAVNVEEIYDKRDNGFSAQLFVVHLRKMRDDVDVLALMAEAEAMPKSPETDSSGPLVRLGMSGPYLPLSNIPQDELAYIAETTVTEFRAMAKMEAEEVYFKLTGVHSPSVTDQDIAGLLLNRYDTRFRSGTPLTSLLIGGLYEAYQNKGHDRSIEHNRTMIMGNTVRGMR